MFAPPPGGGGGGGGGGGSSDDLSLGEGVQWAQGGYIDTGSGYDIRSGKMQRRIHDFTVAGAVGGNPLHQARTCFTYADGMGYTEWMATPYSYKVLSANTQLVSLIYPDGTNVDFGIATGDGVTSLRPLYGCADRVKVNANGTLDTLWLADGSSVVFTNNFATQFRDKNGLVSTASYSGSNITQITDASGRWIQYQYYTVPGSSDSRIRKAIGSDGQWVQYDWAVTATLPVITAATYNDGTSASYIYDIYLNVPLVMRDTRASARMQAVKYEWDGSLVTNSQLWYSLAVYREKNPDTNDVVSMRSPPPGPPSNYTTSMPFKEYNSDGRIRTYNYSTKKLVSLYDSTVGTASFNHDTLGFLTQVTDPAGNVYQYLNESVLHRAYQVNLPDANNQALTFSNAAHPYFVATRRDERGNVTTYTRFSNGVIQRIDYPDGSYETWSGLTAYNQPTSHRLRNGATEWWDFDSAGRLLKHWLPSFSGQTSYTAYSYYGTGHAWQDRVQTETDPLGNVTTYEYDMTFSGGVQTTTPCPGRGLVTKISHSDGSYQSFAYDQYGNKVWEENELRQRTTYTYDAYQRVLTTTDPLGHTTTNDYTHYRVSDNSVIPALANTTDTPGTTTSSTGRSVRTYYNGNARKVKVIAGYGTADAATTTLTYNNLGLLSTQSQQVDASTWRTTTFDYDNRGRQRHQYAPLSRTTEWQYDAAGNVTKIVNPDGTFSTKAYDSMNRPYSATDEMGYTVGYTYIGSGQVNVITDRKGYHYNYEYDASDRKTKFWYPASWGGDHGSSETWSYTADGRVEDYYNRVGQHLHYTYDNRRRETLRAWDGGVAPSVSTGYDAASRVTSRSNSTGSLGYGYDAAGRVTGETQAVYGGPTVAVGFGYDNDNLRTTRDATGESQLGFGYNARGQMNAENYPGLSFGYTYDLSGARTLRTSPNGTASSYSYDGAGRLNLLDSYRVSGHANLLRQDFGFDLRDRRTWALRDSGYGDSYSYQADSELTTFRFGVWRPDQNPNGAPSVLDTYAYDQNGNRSSRNEGGVGTTYTPNALNEYSAVSGMTISHSDGRGNVTQWGGWSYSYDAENRLVSASGPSHSYAFAYDAQGRLAKLTHNGVPEYRFYDGAQLFLRKDSGGTVLERVLWGPTSDETLARWTPTYGWHYFHHDPLNSTVAVTDGSGNVVERYLYDAFGGTTYFDGAWSGRSSSAIANSWTFTGQEWIPDLGLHNYKNRFYNDDLGRFVQQDPLRFDAGDLNLYRYCFNDAINGVDPLGLKIQFTEGSDVVRAIKAWKYEIANNPDAAATFQKLGSSPQLVTINASDTLTSSKTQTKGLTVDWNPKQSPKTKEGKFVSAAQVLYHEACHVERALNDPVGQQIDGSTTDQAYDNLEEKRVIRGPEAKAASILGEPGRFDHKNHGSKKVDDPTEHTPETELPPPDSMAPAK